LKKNIITAIIGAANLSGLVVAAYGQGYVVFDNYLCTPSYPIVYGPGCGVLTGQGAGADVSVELGYALGTNSYRPYDDYLNPNITLIPSSITAVNPAVFTLVNEFPMGGYFLGPVVTIPDYTSGPITFEILAWTIDGGTTFANSETNAVIEWIEPSISNILTPPGYFTALPGDIVFIELPEPATLSLVEVGILGIFVALRRRSHQIYV
jgi:hypothetical protein